MLLSSTLVQLRKQSRKANLLFFDHPVLWSHVLNVTIGRWVLSLIKNSIEEMTFWALENKTDTILLPHFKKSFNEPLIMMYCNQSNVFLLMIASKVLPAKVVAAVATILVSHGEITMENLKNAGKEAEPNNLIPSKLRALWDFVKFHSEFSSFGWF